MKKTKPKMSPDDYSAVTVAKSWAERVDKPVQMFRVTIRQGIGDPLTVEMSMDAIQTMKNAADFMLKHRIESMDITREVTMELS